MLLKQTHVRVKDASAEQGSDWIDSLLPSAAGDLETGDRLRQRSGAPATGRLVGFDADGKPLVTTGRSQRPVQARSTLRLKHRDLNCDVMLLFENDDPTLPIIVGIMEDSHGPDETGSVDVEVDGQRIVLTAKQEIVLRCGEASITLTRAGKILIRGTHVSSRSSGLNKMKGAVVQIN